jgi:hypothetical protein
MHPRALPELKKRIWYITALGTTENPLIFAPLYAFRCRCNGGIFPPGKSVTRRRITLGQARVSFARGQGNGPDGGRLTFCWLYDRERLPGLLSANPPVPDTFVQRLLPFHAGSTDPLSRWVAGSPLTLG